MSKNDFFNQLDLSIKTKQLLQKSQEDKMAYDLLMATQFANQLKQLLKDYVVNFKERGFLVSETMRIKPYYKLSLSIDNNTLELGIYSDQVLNYAFKVFKNGNLIYSPITITESFNKKEIEQALQELFLMIV